MQLLFKITVLAAFAVNAAIAGTVSKGRLALSTVDHEQLTKIQHEGLPRETLATQQSAVLFDVQRSEDSHMPLPLQYLLASTWILMLALLPLLLPIIDNKPPTKTQMYIGVSMLVVLFGGLYLFTQVILFQSIHFKTVRPLTIVECIYFMGQVITTVGYGDITPAKPRGQVFVALYVLGALFIIANVISDLAEHMSHLAAQHKEKQLEVMSARVADKTENPLSAMFKPRKPSWKGFFTALGHFAILDICWIAFFYLYPGEGKTLLQAIYMSVITLSTVGFGWFTPVTEAGMIFGAFWMLFGSAALVNVITEFTNVILLSHEYDQASISKSKGLDALGEVTGGVKQVSELQFLQFALVQMKCIPQSQLNHITASFQALRPKNGKVSLKVIEECIHSEFQGNLATLLNEDIESVEA